MNINVKQLPECKATMRVEVPSEKVTGEREGLVKAFAKQAKIPGFRPGKVPVSVVEQRFKAKIEKELADRLIGECCRSGIKEHSIDVLTVDKVEEVSFNVDGTLSFVAHLTTAPSFELPDYKGIEVKVPKFEITDVDVDKVVESYRERFADFEDVDDRPAETGDFVVIDYRGSIDGKAVGEVIPKAQAFVAQNQDHWLKLEEGSFLPGFAEQLVGAGPGEERTITVTLPDDFQIPEAAGTQIEYAVTVKSVKKQILPEVDDELAAKVEPGKSLEELRSSLRERITSDRERRVEDLKIDQIVGFLGNQIQFELPPEIVKSETQARVDEMVERGQQAGMEDDQIVGQQQQIFDEATRQAHSNVKTSFILREIAKAEGISIPDDELATYINALANQYNTPVKKFVKELQKNRQFGRIRDGMLIRKVLEFLKENASFEEVEPTDEEGADV